MKAPNMLTADPAPIYDNVKRMADFLAKEVGEELALCARHSPDIWPNAYADHCFRSYENLMEFVNCHISCCYLNTVLLAIINKDNEHRDDLNSLDDRKVSDYILKHSRKWFDAYLQG